MLLTVCMFGCDWKNLPRPRGADTAGLLMRELELHPPSEEWNRRTLSGGPWLGMLEAEAEAEMEAVENLDPNPIELWPRKRRRMEHDAGFGLRTAVGLGSFSNLLGSRHDVITSVWKAAQHGIWHKVFSLPCTCCVHTHRSGLSYRDIYKCCEFNVPAKLTLFPGNHFGQFRRWFGV